MKRNKSQQLWQTKLNRAVEQMELKLKRGELEGSRNCSTEVAELVRTAISKGHFFHTNDLMEMVKSIGRRLAKSAPVELAIGNVIRRVLFIIRTEMKEYENQKKYDNEDFLDDCSKMHFGPQLSTLFDEKNDGEAKESVKMEFDPCLKGTINQEITLLIDEIKEAPEEITHQATEHIYAKEVIMTFDISRTVLGFLQTASVNREFEVIVPETAPTFCGQKMAYNLAEVGIEATVISDAAVFAMMSHVSKVIFGPHCVMANGGLIANCGAHHIALAAKYHSVPVVILTGIHKISPLYAFDMDTFNVRKSPGEMISFEKEFIQNVEVVNPRFDYVPPELVTLFITNFGGYHPSYIYRLLAQYYHPNDKHL